MRRRWSGRIFIAFAFIGLPAIAAAQQRPLVTEDPETIGAGRVLIEGGITMERDASYPVSGLDGNRFSVPTLGVSVGVGSIAEIQVDGGLYQHLSITNRNRRAPLASVLTITDDDTSDVEDIVVATKIRLAGEAPGRPALGLRFATKLPNAGNDAGLGTNLTDFHASLLIGKTVQSVRVVGNGGLAILGDPTTTVPAQNDLLTFGVSVARAMTTAAEVVAEVSGRLNFADTPHIGAENRAAMRIGARYTHGPVRFDGAVILGMTSHDPSFGVTGGFTWVLNAFRVP